MKIIDDFLNPIFKYLEKIIESGMIWIYLGGFILIILYLIFGGYI